MFRNIQIKRNKQKRKAEAKNMWVSEQQRDEIRIKQAGINCLFLENKTRG